MKSQKGVTLTSLTIYIVIIFIVLAILATVTSNFQSGIKEINQKGTEASEINKFNVYFLQEVKKQGNDIIGINENSITFSTKNKYEYDSNKGIINLIEENKTIKIAEDIESCEFRKNIENGKTIVTVEIKPKNSDETSTIEYVLNSEKSDYKYEDEQEYTHNFDTQFIE